MPRWKPVAKWKNLDVFVIGGGTSLECFDWSLLEDECTVGCNDAYKLGAKICKICVFGDPKWFKFHQHELVKYEGLLFTNHGNFQRTRLDWLWTLPRKANGLATDALAWNTNTGAAAVNLALILGAKRVILLGFDMHLSNDKQNWHVNYVNAPDGKVYKKFIKGFERLSRDLNRVFPGREIINVNDDSRLNCFPKIECDKFWKERKEPCEI